MTTTTDAADVTITEKSVTLSSEDYRRLRHSSNIPSRTTLRKKLRWLEYANTGETPPTIRIRPEDEVVLADIDPVYTAHQTLEIPCTSEFRNEGESYDGVLDRIWFRVRQPERVQIVYAVEMSASNRTYIVKTVTLDTGGETHQVVRTSAESDPIPSTTADFQLYPHPEAGVFDD